MNLIFKKYNILFGIIVGIVFIISAIMKLNTIDSFEIYIYSLNIFNLNESFIFSRLVISLELILGILLMIRLHSKKVLIFTILILLIFISYITYLMLIGKNEHCHCFGDNLQISHPLSIFKNVILIILLVLSIPSKSKSIKFQKSIFLTIIIIGAAIPFIISPPDSFRIDQYSAKSTYNKVFLNTYLNNNQLNKGRYVICFFATKCRFCKLSANKLNIIIKKSIKKDIFLNVFWGDKKSIAEFYSKTGTNILPYKSLSGNEFLKITNGKMPLIILVNNGEVIKNYGYRSIIDKEIIDFAK